MTRPQRYANCLHIDQSGKGIPYGGQGKLRPDGDANYGFKYAKGDEATLRQIPELAKDPILLDLALAINDPATGLFSVGCLSGPVINDSGYRHTGYMEFAINSRSTISDATCYFFLFFHFDRFLHKSKFPHATRFDWELQGAVFEECDDCSGFTCSVFLNTAFSPTKEEADLIWSESLNALGQYLRSVPVDRDDFLYPQ